MSNTNSGGKLRTLAWGFRLAWSFDKRTLLLWYILCAAIAVLPAIALKFNQQSLSVISGFISGTSFTYADAIKPIVSLGALMIAIGLSARLNNQLVSNMMYDSFFGRMYEYIMDNVQNVEMTDLLRKDVNDLWTSVYLQGNSLRNLVVGACLILSRLVGIIALLVTAFTMSKAVFVFTAAFVAVIFIVGFAFEGKTRRMYTEDFQDERLVEYYEKLTENPGMAKETRIYENTDEVVEQWRKPYARMQKRSMKRERSARARDLILGVGFYAFLIVTIGTSIYGVARGNMRPDIFLVLFTLCLNVQSATSGLTYDIARLGFGLVALDKQRTFFEAVTPPEDDAGKADTFADENTVFDVRNLSFAYADKPAIKDISFKVDRGEIIALVGANGSGKSTLVKLLLNMYKPSGGAVKVFGREWNEYKRAFIRGKISVFFQNFHIFHALIGENIGIGDIGDMENTAKIMEAAKKGGAEKVIANLPQGLNTLLGKFQDPSGTELSGGEKQRVASARAHMSDRDVLIFDEPASMLDPIAEMEQFTSIRNMLGGRTAILISHRVGFARMADKIIMLDDGKIAETGRHDELMAKNGLYAHFFNEQAQWYQSETAKGAAVNG
ncbi:MAG: ABC transporter ATP-binding protein/permease [Oscillospiraceae bacterium]|jgi:ATP-binding cassette subfamily B protein|nr:ABC transporter ATP-binding protein/permease [Oscillospiraceae bacterium]